MVSLGHRELNIQVPCPSQDPDVVLAVFGEDDRARKMHRMQLVVDTKLEVVMATDVIVISVLYAGSGCFWNQCCMLAQGCFWKSMLYAGSGLLLKINVVYWLGAAFENQCCKLLARGCFEISVVCWLGCFWNQCCKLLARGCFEISVVCWLGCFWNQCCKLLARGCFEISVVCWLGCF